MKPSNAHSEAVTRAALPELLFIPDIALALGVTEGAARKAVLRGDCGTYIRLGRRLAVRRESFLAALEAREIDPVRLPVPHKIPQPSPRLTALLKQQRKRGRR